MPDVSAELQSRSLSVTGAAVINGYSEHKELADCFAAYLAEGYADGLYERSGKMPASLQAAENADNGALMIFADEYADSVSEDARDGKFLDAAGSTVFQGMER